MERIIIHNLYRYKLVFVSELAVETSAGSPKEKVESGSGHEDKVSDILYQDPMTGWTRVVNPQAAFEIADINRVKISRDYLKRLNPSSAFFEKRKRSKEDSDPKNKKRRKRKSK